MGAKAKPAGEGEKADLFDKVKLVERRWSMLGDLLTMPLGELIKELEIPPKAKYVCRSCGKGYKVLDRILCSCGGRLIQNLSLIHI